MLDCVFSECWKMTEYKGGVCSFSPPFFHPWSHIYLSGVHRSISKMGNFLLCSMCGLCLCINRWVQVFQQNPLAALVGAASAAKMPDCAFSKALKWPNPNKEYAPVLHFFLSSGFWSCYHFQPYPLVGEIFLWLHMKKILCIFKALIIKI